MDCLKCSLLVVSAVICLSTGKASVLTTASESSADQKTTSMGLLPSILPTTSSQISIKSPESSSSSSSTPHQHNPSSGPVVLSGTTTPVLPLGTSAKDSLWPSSPSPSAKPTSSLTMLAFGVMGIILLMVIVMVVLVTIVNLKGQCKNNKEKDQKGWESVIESNGTNGERESITLVSVRPLNADNDTDSPRLSSAPSTILDTEELEVCKEA
ncbi:endothelial cell-specific chemotaxis regulator isoform X2 [Engraulis encrasicolus]|uniref:endothelial cell-specific chemotaxis regulator isoform X2 n=1 Tax=Engraulis encrasicolus TaxID=184585 RepID=UPI002FD6C3D6